LEKTKKVLVCPLNWGLGHASRVIPVVYELIRCKYDVYIGAEGYSLQLLKQEFPALTFIIFPSFTVSYGKRNSLVLPIILQFPKIIHGIIKEHIFLERLVVKHSIDLIISDNRFGLWSKKAYSIYITHQINILLPGWLWFFNPLINKINRLIISKYNQCWIPDFEHNKSNLTGVLSHKFKIPDNAKFIGPLSRFNKYSENNRHTKKINYDLLVIMSGPEPQRTMLEDILTREIKKSNYRVLIIKGNPGQKQINKITENITAVSHLSTHEFLNVIDQSRYIICRSGYSTIMDLVSLNRTAILIPTPGQTEQEYLARYLSGSFCSAEQNKIKLEYLIKKMNKYEPVIFISTNSELKNNIQNLDFLKKKAKECNSKKS
jgi:uncharacterized protein (TIGR00661 family)